MRYFISITGFHEDRLEITKNESILEIIQWFDNSNKHIYPSMIGIKKHICSFECISSDKEVKELGYTEYRNIIKIMRDSL